MFLSAALMITKTLKQQRCPSVSMWIKCGTFKQWKGMSFHDVKKTSGRLRCILLSRGLQSEKAIDCMIPVNMMY